MSEHAGEERLFGGASGRLLVAVSVGWAFTQAGRLLLSPMLPAIRADLGISNALAGLAFTTLWGLYALLQYPSGRLSDRLSRATLLVAGLGLVSAGFLALAAAPAYPAFLAGAAVVGLGAGLYPTAARALVSDLFVERRGQAFGLHTASGDAGGVLAAAGATVVLAVATWRDAFTPVVVVLIVVALALHRWRRSPYAIGRVALAIRPTAARLFGERRLRRLLFAYVLYAFTWQAVTAFLPTFLRAEKAFPPAVANAGFAALFVVGALVKPAAGGLGDRFARSRVAAGALAVAALALAGVLLAESTAIVGLGVVVFAAGLMAYPPVMQAALMDGFPADSMGGDLGAMRTVYISLGALGPTVVGAVADAAAFAPAFWALVGGLIAASAVVLVAGD